MDRFETILLELGDEIDVDLVPDQNRICQINYMDELHIQLQYDERKESLLIASFLCEVPPGKYREKLLKEALKSNGEYPRVGTLAYSERNNQLTFFTYVPAPGLKAEALSKILESFIRTASGWKEAVERGKSLPTSEGPSSNSGIFGIRP